MGYGKQGRILIVAAHPDDEAIGAGGHLAGLPEPSVLFVTDGAPQDPAFASVAGFGTREEYAEARKAEAITALGIAGIPANRIHESGIKDQEASFHLVQLTQKLCELIQQVKPVLLLTHPYEGGHPDHDAAAFAARYACPPAAQSGGFTPQVVEFTSYHGASDGMMISDFLPHEGAKSIRMRLSEAQQRLKRRMFEAYQSQTAILQMFRTDEERFRLAPLYDFTRPPHAGKLYYENFNWGVDGKDWRLLASEAARRLAENSNRVSSRC